MSAIEPRRDGVLLPKANPCAIGTGGEDRHGLADAKLDIEWGAEEELNLPFPWPLGVLTAKLSALI